MKPTQEQVLTWAREAIGGGALSYTVGDLMFRFEHFKGDTYEFKPDDLITFAALAYDAGRKDENEACANVCDRFQERDVGMQPAECAGAIRARREQ